MSLLIASTVVLWCAHPAWSDQPPQQSSQTVSSPDRSFPNLERPTNQSPSVFPERHGFLRGWLRNQLAHGQEQSIEELRKRPLLYWRFFAERPPHPVRVFFILLFFNFVIGHIGKKRVGVAVHCARKSFWKSLGVGMFSVLLMTSTVRMCYDTELLSPMAGLTMGVLQFLCICGLVVCSRLIGEALLCKLKLAQPKSQEEPTRLQYSAWLLAGTILVASIIALPPLVLSHHLVLPRLGTRIAMWLSMLGLGALMRTRLGRKELV